MIIYSITNLLNGKVYVGQTTRTLKRRFKEHKQDFFSKVGKDIREYGAENFSAEILEECQNISELNEREMFWIKKFNSRQPNGYNVLPGGGNFERNVRKIDELRRFSKIAVIEQIESERVKELQEENENLRQLLLIAQSKLIQTQEELQKNQQKLLVAEKQTKENDMALVRAQADLEIEKTQREVTEGKFTEIKNLLEESNRRKNELDAQLAESKNQLEKIKNRGLLDRLFNHF